MKTIIGIAVIISAIILACYLLVDWAFKRDMAAAEVHCAQFAAKPFYIHDTDYICITSDGRVVG